MKPYVKEIAAMKARIKELALDGKLIREAARKATHTERYNLKSEANTLGYTTRLHLLAYQVLLGRHPSHAESSTTRETFTVEGSTKVYTSRHHGTRSFTTPGVVELLPEDLRDEGRRVLTEWNNAITNGTCDEFKKPNRRLYFAARKDLSRGKCAAQVAHAMDVWTAEHGPQDGTVIVCGVDSEEQLLACLPVGGKTVLWREPDMGGQATVFATNCRLSLPLL